MKYKCYSKVKKKETAGGAYWKDVDVNEHFVLTNHQTAFHYLIKNYKPPLSILEAGCGLGRWVVPLSEKGFDVTGIEIEREAVEIIKKTYPVRNFNIVEGDIFKMPFKAESFDMVISLGVLEHFEDKSLQRQAIQEHLRVLKKDGIFFVTVPYFNLLRLLLNVPYIKMLSLVRKIKGKKESFSEYRYTKSTFKKILEENGLKVESVFWDDLSAPYSFGLSVDQPIKRFTHSKDSIPYKLNKTGLLSQKLFWGIYPGIMSGGIGFICKKES